MSGPAFSPTERLNRFAVTAAGAIALGVVGSGIWDLLAKPGLNQAANAVSRVVTFGSTTVRDLPYSSAALDPSPLPGLVLLYLVTMAPLLGAVAILFTMFGSPRLRRKWKREREAILDAAPDPDAGYEQVLVRSSQRLRSSSIGLAIYLLLSAVGAFVAFTVVVRATDVRRAFFADLAILAPHLSARDQDLLRARFAAMQTEAEWHDILTELRRHAGVVGTQLRPETR